jgi:hypothetical protein
VVRAGVLLSILMLWSARAESGVRFSGSGEATAGGGYDSNLFLQIAASPDSPNYHHYSGGFLRANPSADAALAGETFRLELRYSADLLQTFGSGRLYIQDLDLSLSLPELGPVALRVGATGGRFDAGDFATDRFWSAGALAQATLRFLDHWRAVALYEIDRRQFGDPATILIRDDLSQLGQLRAVYVPHPMLELAADSEYLLLRSRPTDATQSAARLTRLRAGLSASYTPVDTVTLLASVWGGVQDAVGVESDRQGGGAAAVLVRVGRSFDAIARYDLLMNRTGAADSDYSRQVLTIGLVGHLAAARPAGPRSRPPAAAVAVAVEGDLAPLVQDGRVRFRLRAPGAASVVVIGSWNDWQTEAPAQQLQRTDDPDVWEAWVVVGAGDHRYHFVVDGKAVRPIDAPQYRPDGFGGQDGVLRE